jgi:hypothetical protein
MKIEDLQEVLRVLITWISDLQIKQYKDIEICRPSNLFNRDDYLKVYNEWSCKMDEIYTDKNDRITSANWNDGSPEDWMKPFDKLVFNAWVLFDAGDPMWDKELEYSLINKKVEENDKKAN